MRGTAENGILGRIIKVSLLLACLQAVFILLGISFGSTGELGSSLLQALLQGRELEELQLTIIFELRLPRVILAALVGATLGTGGLVFQALLRNPLAEPYILGISGGSAVGAVLGMMLGLAFFPGVTVLSFVGSLLTLFLVVVLAGRGQMRQESSLLLAGVMVNAFCSAIITFLISMTQHSKLQGILFWLMGDLSQAVPVRVLGLFLLVLPCFFLIFLWAKPMNLLQFGQQEAKSMGVNVTWISLGLLVVTSLAVSATVCLVGLVGFVGLLIPHLLRLLLGPEHRVLVPACVLGGGAFMVGCDLLARTISSQGELPVGVITALIGAPAFVFFL
ncbi:MAG: FecCD family ABC transporter permease, partial [Desulfohalobiaceae bacterium]